MVVAKVVILGAGAVGLATAKACLEAGHTVQVLEKEGAPGLHQSGRNSGVIHAGYNLKPGSQKAAFCLAGSRALKAFAAENDVAVRPGGILVVAEKPEQEATLQILLQRGQANGTRVRLLQPDEWRNHEPLAQGTLALLAEDGASLDSTGYMAALANHVVRGGGHITYHSRATSFSETSAGVTVQTTTGPVAGDILVNATGLWADRVAASYAPDMRVVPFRGFYAELQGPLASRIQSHIYAAPDLAFPFLGVHLSRRTDGRVLVGPGAMLAFGREAYRFASFKGGGPDYISWPGFWKMMAKPQFQRLAVREGHKSLALRAILAEARELVPSLPDGCLAWSQAGNRAQMVDRDGNLVEDIVVREGPGSIHVLNAVSPGLTCSLPFGEHLASRVDAVLGA